MKDKRIGLDSLNGEVLTHIDVDDAQIMLTTASGKIINIYHQQDCCESVRILDTQGNWHDLIGKVLVETSHEEVPGGDPAPEYPDSWTITTLKFRVDDATVINRWIGESNGYYSETIDIFEVKNDS